ncbi:MAG: hypothetical protein KC547_21600, partial [Anaerolineae bacterium]|nr:hypothetical protein [Anaerolineae bacterium]
NNRENVARYLSETIAVLTSVHELLMHGDREGLEAALVEAYDTYQVWLAKRTSGRWDEKGAASQEKVSDTLMSGLLGGYITRRLRGDEDRD